LNLVFITTRLKINIFGKAVYDGITNEMSKPVTLFLEQGIKWALIVDRINDKCQMEEIESLGTDFS